MKDSNRCGSRSSFRSGGCSNVGEKPSTHKVEYQLNAALRAAALGAHLHTLLPHTALGALKGPAAELEDVARVDAHQGDC